MKFLFLSILILFVGACKNTPKTTNNPIDTTAKQQAPVAAIEDTNVSILPIAQDVETPTVINYTDSIDFQKYEVGPQKRMENAPIDWESLSGASEFKTRITEAYATNDVNFAGHYILSVFGCGASCIMGFMVDVRDGKIYDLPLGEENSCLFAEDRALCKPTSKLFIAGVCKENQDSTKVYYKAYLWDEDKKEFQKIEENAILKK